MAEKKNFYEKLAEAADRPFPVMALGPLGVVLGGPVIAARLARQTAERSGARPASPSRPPPQSARLIRPQPQSTTSSSASRRPAPADPRLRPPPYAVGHWYEPLVQADTAMRGAANVFFGNEFAAAMDATGGSGAPTWRKRYDDNHAAHNARDAYDAAHRPVAQTIGHLGGIGLAMMLTRGAAAPVARLPGAAKLSGREVTAILGSGGLLGLGSQLGVDYLTGNKSSAGDLWGAGLGGTVNAALLPLGGARAAGAGGATTSAAQDLFNGRAVSLERLGRAYNLAAFMGRVGEDGGRAASDQLPPVQKGRLGEAIGSARSTANTWMREPGKKVERYGAPGTYRPRTILDGRSGVYRFEDKFGYDPTMSDGQLAAQAALGDYFKLYHSVPEDVGLATSLPAAVAGSQVVLERPWPRTLDEATYEEALSRIRDLPQATAVQSGRR